jgi:[CysO sulfur-carrier protein]-S-L-cysteine hydrolase
MPVPVPCLTPGVLREMYAHARETYPDACVGFLLGPAESRVVDECHRCVNQMNRYHALDPERFPRTARTGFILGGSDLRFIMQRRESPRPVKIMYHSYADGLGTQFSWEDTRGALDREPDATARPAYCQDHLVIDARANRIGGAKLFRWDPAQIAFVPIAEYAGAAI